MRDQAAEATIAAVASKATQAGGATMIFGWWTVNDFVLIVGLIATIAGFVVNFYYRRKDSRMRTTEHAARMAMLHRGIDPDE